MIIINIGDELLIGQVVNSNAAYMGTAFSAAGFPVKETYTIGDDEQQIIDTFRHAFEQTKIVVVTGGLGPTKDDITKKAICDFFGTKLVMDAPTLSAVTSLTNSLGIALSEINRQQALVPDGCTVLPNHNGTAPGLWIEKEDKLLISLPGVPYEMESLITEEVIPRLIAKYATGNHIIHKVVQMCGISESALSDLLETWELQLPKHIRLAYLPRPGIMRLRLSGNGTDQELLEAEMTEQVKLLTNIAGDYIFSFEDNQMEEVIGSLLRRLHKNLAVAESCTGGYLSHLITSVPGSSSYFKGGVISYSNEIKREILNVRELNLKKHGAVSEYVVNDMAINLMGLYDVDYTIAVSGIAGPDGGTAEKPVGTVWIAVATTTRIKALEFHFGTYGGRKRIIERAAVAALNMLRIELLKDLR